MTSSIIFLIIFGLLSLGSFFTSYNRLLRSNIASFIALFLITTIYVIDKYVLSLSIYQFLSTLFSSIFSFLLMSFDLNEHEKALLLWAVFILLLYLTIYGLVRIILHYTMVGRNPTLPKRKRERVVQSFNIVFSLIASIMVSGFISIFSRDVLGINFGFLNTVFEYFYQGVNL